MKLLYIVNVDWFFISHRLPIALAAIEQGYDVHIACADTGKKDYLESLGINVHPISLSRSGTSIFNELKVLKQLWQVVKEVKPDISHAITIKGVVYGGLVTRFLKVKKRVASISGLGYVFIDESLKARLLKGLITRLYSFALGSDTKVIFQNSSDESIFVKNIIHKSQSIIIRGSGVDLNALSYAPEPTSPKTVMFLARLLKDKGLVEFCEAAKIVKKQLEVRFVLVGDVDFDNPNSISQPELDSFIASATVEHWGYAANVQEAIAKSNIMVLPSYREGLPKSLLEAAACGRAVITTDVPGCRDAITPDITGLLVPVKNIDKLAETIIALLNNDEKRTAMGAAGRKLAEEAFDIEDVVKKHLMIYKGSL